MALADDPTYDGKITINNATSGQTYTLYKVFDAVITSGRTDGGAGINYTSTWNFDTNDYFEKDTAGNVKAKSGAFESGSTTQLSSGAITWLKNNKSSFTTQDSWRKQASGTSVEWTGLTAGYYFIDTTVGTVVTVDSITPDVVVTDKNVGDTIEKEQKGGDTTSFTGNDITADIGDIIDYQIKVTIQPNTENCVVYDTLASGLTLVTTDNSGNTITAPTVSIDSDYYTVGRFNAATGNVSYTYNESPSGASKTKTVNGNIVISFTQDYINSLTTATDVTISYKAMVNDSAAIATDIPNTVNLVYGHNYDMDQNDVTKLKTYQFGLYKTEIVSSSHNIISSAEFKMYSDSSATTEIPLVLASTGVYRPATQAEQGASGFTAATIVAGNVIIKGLQNGIYYVNESKAPDGYNKVDTIFNITINNANAEGTVVSGVYTEGSGGIEVVNAKGTELPSTGGIGTTIFYVAGIVLVLGAVAVILARRKAEQE